MTRMASAQCGRCTAERRGFRRELDSWRLKLIHCIGFESILEGIYGPMLLRDLKLFEDCEPEEVDDWSPESSGSQCSFCNLPLDKSSDQVFAATPPLSPPSDYSPSQAQTVSESSQAAQRFLQAMFHKKDVPLGCDSNIPLIAKALMKKMIHRFAMEYASKCLLHTTANGVTRTSSPLSETSDAPLDLTVSRPQEENESEPPPDGVLDLSNRNSACSVIPSSPSNHKASGFLHPTPTEELGDLSQRGTKICQHSALGGILYSLCSPHQSLLYQMLKLAHQEKLLDCRPEGQTDSLCCNCSVNAQNNLTQTSVPLNECKSPKHTQHYPLTDYNHQNQGSSIHHSATRKSCQREIQCEQSFYTVPCAKSPVPSSSLCLLPPPSKSCDQHNHLCLIQARNAMERGGLDGDPSSPGLKRDQSPSPPPLSPVPSEIRKKTDEMPPSLVHHRQDEVDLDSLVNVRQKEADLDTAKEALPCKTSNSHQTVQSPNGTLLQVVMNRFNERLETIRPLEKDPSIVSTTIYVSEKEQLQSPLNSPNLQFHADAHSTEIITTVLHTGSPNDYSLTELFDRHNNRESKPPNTWLRRRQGIQAAINTPADDASTRRHTLQIKRELARLDQSCNRKKVLPAKKPRLKDGCVNTATSHSSSDVNISKEMCKETDVEPVENCIVKTGPLNMLIPEGKRNEAMEVIRTATPTEAIQSIKAEDKEKEISSEKKDLTQTHTLKQQCKYRKWRSKGGKCVKSHMIAFSPNSAKQCGGLCKDGVKAGNAGRDESHEKSPPGQCCGNDNRPCKVVIEIPKCQSNHLKESRRSKRNIVPPQRFSSYVTEPRKMFFVACFSDSIFNSSAQKDKSLPNDPDPRYIHQGSKNKVDLCSDEHTENSTFESPQNDESKDQCQILPKTLAAKEESPKNLCSDINDCGSSCLQRLRSSKKILQISKTPKKPSNIDAVNKSTCLESPLNSQFPYTSPIKLMFVSPVKDKKGIRYSLKSVSSSSGAQEDSFDPYVESSWAGTPQNHKTQTNKSARPQAKSATSCTRSSAGSPSKSASASPAKSSSCSLVKSASGSPAKLASGSPSKSGCSSLTKSSLPKSSPKSGSKRTSESTPTKHVSETENQRLSSNTPSFHETTPPKRRPGRPKKIGPQLEQKEKRPIGRPRKQKAVDCVLGVKEVTGKCNLESEAENVNKNLKITVMYGRSRRNKRVVSESFDHLQREFNDAWQAMSLKNEVGVCLHNSKIYSGSIKAVSEERNFLSLTKRPAQQSSHKIQCQKQTDSAPSRKPGRPAKVKVSGISVTVTTVSPRQRKIQINKETQDSPESLHHKRKLLPEFRSAKEPQTISHQVMSKTGLTEGRTGTTQDCSKEEPPNQPVAVRHSMRVRKPSIHFLHAVATSTFRSYSRSNALLRRSKQLLLNKASNEKKQEEQRSSVETLEQSKQFCGQKRKNISPELRRLAGISVDSIFAPKETLRWWAASAEKNMMDQELARRIRVISDTWVTDTVENQEKEIGINSDQPADNCSLIKSNHSVVRTLFDCPPNKPRSCSMQQICSWFMQTTETQSLAIIKKASSRNPYEVMHFPRSANIKRVCKSPQAERLRKHVKKFAKIVPKTPLQHQNAQRQLIEKNKAPLWSPRRRLFMPRFTLDKLNRHQEHRGSAFGKYQATLIRAKTRFLTQKKRVSYQNRHRVKTKIKVAACFSNGYLVDQLQPKRKALWRSAKNQHFDCLEDSSGSNSADQTQEPVGLQKEENLCSNTWSPETLKECRVFLRKINSPNNDSIEEEWDCSMTLDDVSPSAYLCEGRDKKLVVVKAVKTERKRCTNKRTASRLLAGSAPKSVQELDAKSVRRQKSKCRSSGVVSTEPPAKKLRQSRMRGLTGPRWCDFVFGS